MRYKVNRLILIQLFLFCGMNFYAQNSKYSEAYLEVKEMLEENYFDFKRAVFLTENTYFEGQLDESEFYETIRFYAFLSKEIVSNGNIEYFEKDKSMAMAQCAVFMFITDTISILHENSLAKSIPFSYNHQDFAGQKDWSNMFVSKLMETNIGNCHSLPYLYKMTELYTDIHKLGYRKMPQQMYANWLNSLNVKDRNQGIKAIMNPSIKMK